MGRHKNANWTLPEPQVQTWEQAQVAVLMDIRDELQELNRLFRCGSFLRMPRDVAAIRKNTTRKPRDAAAIRKNTTRKTKSACRKAMA